MEVIIIVDAFRAFATACYILRKNPLIYFFTNECKVVRKLKKVNPNALLIGKPEIGSNLLYTIPNSPTRVQEINISGQSVIHRTTAGGFGVKLYKAPTIVLGASFVNAKATANAILRINPSYLKIMPMGYEAKSPSLEDDLCATYIYSLIEGSPFVLEDCIKKLREGPGRYFFGPDQNQYPKKDFFHCLAFNTFPFPIFVENCGNFAILRKRESFCLKESISPMMT